jgi:hypothetical protein
MVQLSRGLKTVGDWVYLDTDKSYVIRYPIHSANCAVRENLLKTKHPAVLPLELSRSHASIASGTVLVPALQYQNQRP